MEEKQHYVSTFPPLGTRFKVSPEKRIESLRYKIKHLLYSLKKEHKQLLLSKKETTNLKSQLKKVKTKQRLRQQALLLGAYVAYLRDNRDNCGNHTLHNIAKAVAEYTGVTVSQTTIAQYLESIKEYYGIKEK